MAVLRDNDQRFKNLERKVGIFVLCCIFGLLAIIIVIGLQQDIFTPKSRIYFITTTGTGIYNGMSVKLSGFKIGKVEQISLDNGAMVKVVLLINSDYMKWVKINSKAYLKKEELIGDSIIEISRGADDAIGVSGDALIPFEREKGLVGIAEDFSNDMKPVISHVTNILEYVSNPNGELKQTIVNLKKVSSELSKTVVSVDTVIKNTDKNIPETFDNVNTLLKSSKQTIVEAGEIIKKTDKTIANLESITGAAKDAVPKITPAIPVIVNKSERIADGTLEIVDSLKQTWPISINIKPINEQPQPVKIDSYE
jgi:phospholipid/cholesterol/gamma-HCH transport system substrate-binding protein